MKLLEHLSHTLILVGLMITRDIKLIDILFVGGAFFVLVLCIKMYFKIRSEVPIYEHDKKT